jgi:hypothetical protein
MSMMSMDGEDWLKKICAGGRVAWKLTSIQRRLFPGGVSASREPWA